VHAHGHFSSHGRFGDVKRSYIGMRVAIFVLCLLGISAGPTCLAQGLDAQDVPVFSGAVPVVAMTAPGFKVPELARHAPNAAANLQVRVPRAAVRVAKAEVTDARSVSGNANGLASAPRGARPAQPPVRSMTDHLLTGVVGLMLIAYQLRRKHRVLRPHPFAT
jgi:hypothetical protein